MVEQSSNNKNQNKLISSSPYISINELRKEVKKNKHGVEKRKYPEMKNKERGREVEERSIWCPVFSLVPRFFFFKKNLPAAARFLPPPSCCPQNLLQCMCCPEKHPKNPCAARFFPLLAAAPFLLFPLKSPAASRPLHHFPSHPLP